MVELDSFCLLLFSTFTLSKLKFTKNSNGTLFIYFSIRPTPQDFIPDISIPRDIALSNDSNLA